MRFFHYWSSTKNGWMMSKGSCLLSMRSSSPLTCQMITASLRNMQIWRKLILMNHTLSRGWLLHFQSKLLPPVNLLCLLLLFTNTPSYQSLRSQLSMATFFTGSNFGSSLRHLFMVVMVWRMPRSLPTSSKPCIRSGSARTVIEGLSLSVINTVKPCCLKQRYDRPRLLHKAHVRTIMDTPSLKDGSRKELHRLHYMLQQHLRALTTMKYESDPSFITSLIEIKLDEDQRNVVAVMSGTRSRCTALTTQQVNRHNHIPYWSEWSQDSERTVAQQINSCECEEWFHVQPKFWLRWRGWDLVVSAFIPMTNWTLVKQLLHQRSSLDNPESWSDLSKGLLGATVKHFAMCISAWRQALSSGGSWEEW